MTKINKMSSLKLGLAAVLGILVITALASASIVFAQTNNSTIQSVAPEGPQEDIDLGILTEDVILDDVDTAREAPDDGDSGSTVDSSSDSEPTENVDRPADTGNYDSGLTGTISSVAPEGTPEDIDLGVITQDVILDDGDAEEATPADGNSGSAVDSSSDSEPRDTGDRPADTGNYDDSGLMGTISSVAPDGPPEDVDLGLLLDDVNVGQENLSYDYDYITESGSDSDGN